MATLAVFGLYAGLWLAGVRLRRLGLLAAALALATVFATAMIYAQMRSVPRWRSPLTPHALPARRARRRRAPRRRPPGRALAPRGPRRRPARRLVPGATARLARSGTHARHRHRPRRRSAACACSSRRTPARTTCSARWSSSSAAATRGSSASSASLLAVLLPLALVASAPGTLALGSPPTSTRVGVLVLRWLFFAEAEHVVGLYYGKR